MLSNSFAPCISIAKIYLYQKTIEDRRKEGRTDKYTWQQTEEDITITLPLPREVLKKKNVFVDMKKAHLKVGLKGEPPLLDVRYCDFNPSR